MACELGCEDYRVLIQNRCGSVTLCDLTANLADIAGVKVLDDTGEVKIKVSLSGAASDGCCDCVGDIRSWIHTMTVFRGDDTEPWWGPGPIVQVRYGVEEVEITARDISAWLDVRVIHKDYTFVQADPIEIARTLIADGFDPDDPCALNANVIVFDTPTIDPILIDRTYEAGKQYVGEALRELARTVLDFTVVGQSIIIGRELSFGPFTNLSDEDFMVEIDVIEVGLETATKWYVNGETVEGTAGGVDEFYGLIEQISSEEGVLSQEEADAAAQNRLDATSYAPLFVNSISGGARLRPTATVCQETLVPGTLVTLFVNEVCRQTSGVFRMVAVSFSASGGDEEVGITLAPVGTTADQAGGVLS